MAQMYRMCSKIKELTKKRQEKYYKTEFKNTSMHSTLISFTV